MGCGSYKRRTDPGGGQYNTRGFMTAQYAGFGWITDGYGYQPLFDAVHGKSFEDDGRYERVVLKLE